MSKWALATGPELVPVPLDPRHFKQLLAEIAEILYDSYCQLHRKEKPKSQPIGNSSSPESRQPAADRKGSHD